MQRKTDSRVTAIVVLSLFLFLAACSTLSVKVIDEADQPIAGAQVEAKGERVTTGPDGIGTLSFKKFDFWNPSFYMPDIVLISIMAENRMPATLQATLPLDSGKTMQARLGKPVEINMNVKSNVNVAMPSGAGLQGMFLTALYPVIFQSLFTANGYNMEVIPYKTGEWTEWTVSTGDRDPMILKKAFLTKLKNKQEWWQVQMNNKKQDGFTFEVLFSQERQSIRRMRQKTGSEGKASEVPVTEGWYSAPMRLTPESMDGAVTERGVEVTVPAGTFKADVLEFAYAGTNGKVRMYRAKGVPGGIVKVETIVDDENKMTTELKQFGTGAKTVLASF